MAGVRPAYIRDMSKRTLDVIGLASYGASVLLASLLPWALIPHAPVMGRVAFGVGTCLALVALNRWAMKRLRMQTQQPSA